MPVHSTAIIHPPSVEVDPSNDIGPYVVIEEGVTLGSRNRILAGAHLCPGTTIGDENEIHMHAVIGHQPQDHAFSGEPTFTRIGSRNVIREMVQVHRGTAPGSSTEIGDECYLMATSHVAHNCRLGNKVTLANVALLAGHVSVGDGAFISGHVVIHQFCRIGPLAMISGHSAVNKDLIPYMIGSGRPMVVVGPNKVGLRRAGKGPEVREALQQAVHTLYRSGLPLSEAIETLSGDATPEVQDVVSFIQESKRGICRGVGQEGEAPPDD